MRSHVRNRFHDQATYFDGALGPKSRPRPVETHTQRLIDRAPHLSPQAKLIEIADKICTVRDVTSAPPTGWSRARRAEYVEWAAKVVGGCRGIHPALEQAFDEALRDARAGLVER